MRILIIKTSSLGDIIHCLPVLADLKKYNKDLEVDWVVEEYYVPLLKLSKHPVNVIPIALRRWRKTLLSSPKETWSEMKAFFRRLRTKKYDRVVDVQGLIKSAVVARLVRRTAKGVLTGYDYQSAAEGIASFLYQDRIEVRKSSHAILRCRELVSLAVNYTIDIDIDFDLSAPVSEKFKSKKYAVLLHSTSKDEKLWPEDRWVALARWLREHHLEIYAPWGSDEEKSRAFRMKGVETSINIPPKLSLMQMSSFLSSASLVIGLDTGLSHLSSALGRPTVGIFTDTDPRLVGMKGSSKCASVGGEEITPTLDEVKRAVVKVMTTKT